MDEVNEIIDPASPRLIPRSLRACFAVGDAWEMMVVVGSGAMAMDAMHVLRWSWTRRHSIVSRFQEV